MARTVGIGIQDFSQLIENDYFYIDKTDFIKEWWENGDAVTLINRPRRFGKTLTMRMVEQFFSINYAGREELFRGFSIWEDEKYHKLQGTYPVIFLSFAAVKENNYQDAHNRICELIAEEYNQYYFLLDSGHLTQPEKNTFNRIANNEMRGGDAVSAVNYLSKFLSRYYGRKAIILLDEYDTPMQEAYVGGFWDEIVGFMRNFFNASFKTNPYLERGLMTGITRVSKESIFSDLNNITVITTTSNLYKKCLGFTEEEVFYALEEYGLSDKGTEVKAWYDGFKFGDCDSIYNPWSIINFLKNKKFSAYWVNTSSNKLIEKLIRAGSPDIKFIIEDLLRGGEFHAQIDEDIVYNQLENDDNAIWSLFLASGYLKIKDYCFDDLRGGIQAVLKITNKEVSMMFNRLILSWFHVCRTVYNKFIQSLLADDKEAMNVYMNEVALAVFSIFDTGKQPSTFKQPENFYHGFVLGLLVELRERYVVTSNRESGFGRYDVLLEPIDKGKDDGIILEFKVHDPSKEKTAEDTVQNALQQIVDKKYAAALEAAGVLMDRIRIYGFAFEGKNVFIDGGYFLLYERSSKNG